jgi:pimeloyl-ACP methyl ester carboxylesterase/class 3 adenylate cyclase
MSAPQTRYAKRSGVAIAYQVLGDGPVDVVWEPPWISNIELYWEEPSASHFLNRLASFSRLIMFDRRNTGSSDRSGMAPSLEEQVDDLRAVMDEVSSERAALVGASEGGSQCVMFAATYPERVSALVLYGTNACFGWSEETPSGWTEKNRAMLLENVRKNWGTALGIEAFAPSRAEDENFREWWARLLRLGASPDAAIANLHVAFAVDVRAVLPAVRVPTLVIHRTEDRMVRVENGRYLAEKIPGARLVEVPGADHFPFVGDTEVVLDEIEEFLTGTKGSPAHDRVLTTVLFIDIVDSTRKAAVLGDHRWTALLDSYDQLVRRELDRFRGIQVKTTGDGTLATFDGPARAIRCACVLRDELRALGLELRSGIHTGEIELRGADIGGIAVHIASRIMAQAEPGAVVVSGAVPPLVAGSGIQFEERGEHELKGVPQPWRLCSVK